MVANGSANLTRLVILWLLSEGPLHGYRIRTILDDKGLGFWFPVEYASIYTVLRTLVKGGQVKVVAIEKEGKRPERTRYAITRAGREHLKELLELAWRDLRSPADSLQLALAARSELTEERITELIAERIEGLRARMRDLSRLANSAPVAEMVDRQTALTSAELSWAERLLTEMGGNRDGS